MDKVKEIVAFASKWYEILHKEQVKFSQKLEENFCADCVSLGFNIEVGEDIIEKYYEDSIEDGNEDLENVFVLSYHLHELNDTQNLGSMIYYFWIDCISYFYYEFEPIDEDDLAWLLVAINHLRTIAMNQQPLFINPISKICLRSDIRKRDFSFNSNVGVFQELSIDGSGFVSFKNME